MNGGQQKDRSGRKDLFLFLSEGKIRTVAMRMGKNGKTRGKLEKRGKEKMLEKKMKRRRMEDNRGIELRERTFEGR